MNLNPGLAKSALNTDFAMIDGRREHTSNAIIKMHSPDGDLQIPSLSGCFK